MKKLIVIVLFLAACGGKDSSRDSGGETTTTIPAHVDTTNPGTNTINNNAEIDKMYAEAKARYEAKDWKDAYDKLTAVAARYKNDYQPPKSDLELKEVTDAIAWCQQQLNNVKQVNPPPDNGGSIIACDTCPVKKQKSIIQKQ